MLSPLQRIGRLASLAIVLSVASSACGSETPAAQPAAQPTVSAKPDRAAACTTTRQVMNEVDEALKQAMIQGNAKDPAQTQQTIKAKAEQLNALTPNDPEMAALLRRYAKDIAAALEVLTTDNFEEAIASTADSFGESQSLIEQMCTQYWKPVLSAEAQQIVKDSCAKIKAVKAPDGSTPDQLWEKVRAKMMQGAQAEAAKQELIAVWERFGVVADSVKDEIPRGELNEFRSQVLQVGLIAESAAFNLKQPDGISQTEKYLNGRRQRDAHRTFERYCASA